MEPEELPHAITPRTPCSTHPLPTRGEVPNQQLQPLARGELATRAPVFRGLHVAGAHTRAPFRAYVLQALHRLAQLRVQALLVYVPSPPFLPLFFNNIDISSYQWTQKKKYYAFVCLLI